MVTKLKRKLLHGTHDFFFKKVHNSWLIYNASWEDPRIDRQLLELDENSKVVVLTSAGCNALDYLLDSPAEINAIDMNPRQNALLNLKLAIIKHRNFEDLFKMFGEGSHQDFRKVYADVRDSLSDSDKEFWDKKIVYFDTNSRKKSFYYYGASGLLAWMISKYLTRNKELRDGLFSLFDAQSLEQQKEIFDRIEPMIWGKFMTWLVRQPSTMALAGVPRPQIDLIKEQYPGGLGGFISDKFRHVFTEILAEDNYFWRVYLTGSYSSKCCPNYLKSENFFKLRTNANSVKTHNNTVTGFLKENPGEYTHFILLDHQDWLAQHDPIALEEEWQMILKNSAPGSKILMRSAATEIDFLPQQVTESLRFFPEKTDALHVTDRVGTYGSLYFAEVL